MSLRSGIGYGVLAALLIAIGLNAAGALSDAMLEGVFLASVGWMIFRAFERPLGVAGAALAAFLALAGLIALQQAVPSLRYTPYLVIVPVNLFLAVIFARGLLPGRRPVLLALIEIMGRAPADDRGFQRFVAGQCALWSVMALATALLAFAAMLHAPARAELAGALQILIGVQVAWFALSHYYASFRYGRPETWWTTLSTMARADIWTRLRAP